MDLLSDLLEPTPQDRLQAIATILARGLRRLRSQRHSVTTESPENSLILPRIALPFRAKDCSLSQRVNSILGETLCN